MQKSFLIEAQPKSPAWRIYGAVAAYLVAVRLLVSACPGVFRSTTQAQVFDWPMLAIWIGAGAIGAVLAHRVGFPGPWDRRIGRRWRVHIPIALGIVFGVAAVITDGATHWTGYAAQQVHQPSIHIPWPASLVIYPGGAIIVEVIYRLLPISLLLWLASSVMLRGRANGAIFWLLALATSLIEPLGDLDLRVLGAGTMLAVFVQDYALNLGQAYIFRRAGFLAALLTSVSFYMVWHVAWGLVAR